MIQNDVNLEYFKVSLQNFSIYNTPYIVTTGADTITINSVPITIPHGNYTYARLAKTLQTYTNATVQWNQDQNTVTFAFSTSHTLSFDKLGTTLGFIPATNYTGTNITSITPMTPYDQTHIMIHLANISPIQEHLCFSNHTGEVKVSNILAKVFINASPFQLITHQQILETEGIYSSDDSLGFLEFMITDNSGNIIPDLPEHEMVLTIESVDLADYDMKDVISELKDISSTMKDLLMYKVLRR
jgi:hypothetical protein